MRPRWIWPGERAVAEVEIQWCPVTRITRQKRGMYSAGLGDRQRLLRRIDVENCTISDGCPADKAYTESGACWRWY